MSSRRKVLRRIRMRVDCVDVDPVGKEDGAVCGDAFGEGALDHLEEMLETRVKAKVKNFSKANARAWMGPWAGSRPRSKAASTSKSCTWSQEAAPVAWATKSARGAQKKVGSTVKTTSGCQKSLAEHDGKAAEHEGGEMRDAFEAGGLGGDVEGRAEDDGLGGVYGVRASFRCGSSLPR